MGAIADLPRLRCRAITDRSPPLVVPAAVRCAHSAFTPKNCKVHKADVASETAVA